MQVRVGATPDGFWGPLSIAACQKHLCSLMPSPNPWPKPTQTALTAFYGDPGDSRHHTQIDVTGLGLRYDGKPVSHITCHKKVAAPLLRVLREIAASPFRWVLAEYNGCYANRPMRGGRLPSLHARAAAIDLLASKNGNKTSWPARANMPLEVMEMFAKEGFKSAGAFWGRDAMHHEGTS